MSDTGNVPIVGPISARGAGKIVVEESDLRVFAVSRSTALITIRSAVLFVRSLLPVVSPMLERGAISRQDANYILIVTRDSPVA